MIPYKPVEFGFSTSADHLLSVEQFRDAAVADGWSIAPTYPSHEPAEQAATLNRDGFIMMVLARPKSGGNTGNWTCSASVHIWGPDGMAIPPPPLYDWAKISAGVTTCGYCGAHPVKTERVGFAGRACPTCRPIEGAKLPRNWAD